MIITVTLNPAIDKTVRLPGIQLGEMNRISGVRMDAGGKGINVSKTIRSLGGRTIATGYLGGSTGAGIRTLLENLEIEHHFVEISGETRTNLKLIDDAGQVTELNEPGPTVREQEMKELRRQLGALVKPGDLVTLSGSIPEGEDNGCYAELTELLHRMGAVVFMDADRELFARGLLAKPDIIKPNIHELEQYCSRAGITCAETEPVKRAVALGTSCLDMGITEVLVSMGGEGAVFLSPEAVYFVPVLPVRAISTVGAGDAIVAAYAYGLHQGIPLEERIRLCAAVSAGAVTTPGTAPADRKVTEALLGQAVLRKM